MRISIVATGFPGSSGGSLINLLVLVNALKELGHDVNFIKIDVDSVPPAPVDLDVIRFKATRNPNTTLLPNRCVDPALSVAIRNALDSSATELAVFYGYEPLSLLDFSEFRAIKKVALLGDPAHLVVLEKIRNSFARYKEYGIWNLVELARFVVRFLRFGINAVAWWLLARKLVVYDWGFATAAHHARFFSKFNPQIFYHPSPVIAASYSDVNALIRSRLNSRELRFLYIGHNLGGTSNSGGVRSLIELIGKMEQTIGPLRRDWKLMIAGNTDQMDPRTHEFLKSCKHVELVGNIDLDSIAESVSLLINTIPYKLGNRTRIASCSAYGIPVVSHVAAVHGMPYLATEGGALLYANEREYLDCLSSVAQNNSVLERLSIESYDTFKRFYSKDNLKELLSARLGQAKGV